MRAPSHRKAGRRKNPLPAIAIIACLAVIAAVLSVHFLSDGSASAPPASSSSQAAAADPAIRPPDAKLVCDQPVLDSPYSYHGAPGAYSSGTPGLPTYGTPNSDFPDDTAGVVLPAGKNDYFSYQLSPNTVYYLLPGTHIGYFQADTNDAFVGGRSGGSCAPSCPATTAGSTGRSTRTPPTATRAASPSST